MTDSFIGIVDSKRQTYVSHSKFDVNTGEARAHGDGLYCANVGTVCKHVVKQRTRCRPTVRPTRRWRVCRGRPGVRSDLRVDHAQGAILGDTFAQFAEYVDANSDKPDDAKIETGDRRGEAHPHGAEKVPTVGGMRRWPIPSSVTITFTTPEYRSNCGSDGGHLLHNRSRTGEARRGRREG